MLLQLRIQNLATIESLEVEFFPGFSILTGETGAGKSIMIDALQLLLGSRADFGLIRHGQEQAQVEGVFDISQLPALQQQLRDNGIQIEQELLVRRVLTNKNRQKRLINDTSVTQNFLAEVGQQLVHIHGQHDNQTLLDPGRHLDFLDDFAHAEPLRGRVCDLYQQWQQAKRSWQQWQERIAARQDRQMLLEAQCREIAELNPQPEEAEELEQEARLLAHAEQLLQGYAGIQSVLYEEDGSVIEVLSGLRRPLQEAMRLDPGSAELLENLEQGLLQLNELSQGLSRRRDKIEDNPERLAWVNERLSALQRMQRKYRAENNQDLIRLLGERQQELEALERLEEDAEHLEAQITSLSAELLEAAQQLSETRRKAATALDEAIGQELRELGMVKAVFQTEVEIRGNEAITPSGMDRVEFLLSVNPGQAPRPLARVASGGELSRVMLAIQTVLTCDTVETLIFDEVDTGISGGIAEIVGRKLASLGHRQQTLCITHLPQIAAFAQQHYAVAKEMDAEQTFTSIQSLAETAAVQELARLMGGTEITPQTQKLAREMRRRSQQMLSRP